MALRALFLLLLAFPSQVSADEVFAGVSYTGWQESLHLRDSAGTEFTLVANTHGPCMGVGWGRRYPSWGFSGRVCAFVAQSDVGSESPTLIYRESSLDTVGGMLGPGIHYYPPTGQVALGIVAPLFLAHTNWAVPDPTYTIDSRTRFSASLLVEAQYHFGRVVFQQRFGSVIGVGWLWGVGLDYLL
jgi:hypothetical protein